MIRISSLHPYLCTELHYYTRSNERWCSVFDDEGSPYIRCVQGDRGDGQRAGTAHEARAPDMETALLFVAKRLTLEGVTRKWEQQPEAKKKSPWVMG